MTNLLKPVLSCIFPVMCDEYTEVSIKEQLTFCMRWVNNDIEFSEKFLGFHKIPDLKISTLVIVMKDILLRYQLKLDMCRGQCHDGASSMFGKLFGVATQFFAEKPKLHYTHFHAHLLLLSIKDAIKGTKILQNGKQNANLSNIPTTQERNNHQLVPQCISLMVPLAKDAIFTQPHVKTATE